MANILLVGGGYIGGRVANALVEQGHQVTVLKRSKPQEPFLACHRVGDVSCPKTLDDLDFDVDQLIYILSPDGAEVASYQAVFEVGVDNLLSILKKRNPKVELLFVSSTRVYGQQQGEWLNEKSETKPVDDRGMLLLSAEKKFLAFNEKTTIVRFSGIYGRLSMGSRCKKVIVQREPPRYTNRIHWEDCVGALVFLINKKHNGALSYPIYIATDHEPEEKWIVEVYLSGILGLNNPVPRELEENLNRNKRLDNKRLIEEGYKFKFKNYREGYAQGINEK